MTPRGLALAATLGALLAAAAEIPAQAPDAARLRGAVSSSGAPRPMNSQPLSVRFDGERISVEARQASLRGLLETIATEAGLTLRLHGEGDRLVTASLEGLRLEEALERIVRGDYVLSDDQLIVFLSEGSARGSRQHEEGLPREPARAGSEDRQPVGPSMPVVAPDHPWSPPTPGSASADVGRAPSATPAESPGVRTVDTPPDLPSAPTSGDPRVRRRSTKPGGIAIVRPPAEARQDHSVDPAEARRLSAEVQAHAADPGEVEVMDLPTIQSTVQSALP